MNRIATLRKERHLTQAQLADRLGVSRTLIVGYESEQVKLSTHRLEQLCQIFSVSADYLLGRTVTRDVDNMPQDHDIKRHIENVISEVMIGNGRFDGQPMSQGTKCAIVHSLKNSIELGAAMQKSDVGG